MDVINVRLSVFSAKPKIMKTPRLVRFILILGGLVGLAGCSSTPESRIRANEAAFASASPEDQQAIRAGEVRVGFTREQVKLALGDPDGVSTRTTEAGTQEVWSYQSKRPRIGIGLGVGGGGGSTSVGGGVGVSTGGEAEPRLRIVFNGDRVSGIERFGKRKE